MSSNPQSRDEWQPCPPGILSGMLCRLSRQRRRAVVARLAVAGAVLLFGGVVTWQMLASAREHELAGMTCREVMRQRDVYKSGRLATANPQLAERVKRHLAGCRHCAELFDAAAHSSRLSLPNSGEESGLRLLALDR